MRNVMGGVEDTGLSFKLTPPPGAAGGAGFGAATTPTLTPPKALLMNQVRGGAEQWPVALVAGWGLGCGAAGWAVSTHPLPALTKPAPCCAALWASSAAGAQDEHDQPAVRHLAVARRH